MKTAEEILKETLNLKGEINEKDYWMTVKVKDCLKAINKALAISRVSCQREQLMAMLTERILTIQSEPDGIVRETMINNLLIDINCN